MLHLDLSITAIDFPIINYKEKHMKTTVKYAAYRNGVKISQGYAKREIARAHCVNPDDVEIISITIS